MNDRLLPPPGPSGLPLIGNALPVLGDFLGFLDQLRPLGDLATFRVFNHQVYLVNRPEFIEEVLVTHRARFHKGPAVRYARRVLGEGLITLDGEKHRRHRAILHSAFHGKAIASYARSMVAEAAQLSSKWREGDVVDMYAEMLEVSLKIALRSLLAVPSPEEADWMSRDFNFFLTEFSPRRFLFPRLSRVRERFRFGKEKRIWEAKERLDSAIYRLIAAQRNDPSQSGIIALMSSKDPETGAPLMSDSEIRDEVVTLLGAGHATTSLGMTYAWYFMARHPEVRRRVEEELKRELGERNPSMEDWPRLTYLRMVLKETLRLLPPIFFIGLVAAEEHRFGDWRVPAGSIVAVSPYVTHRDERHFPEPLRFDPERWREPVARHKFAYFPFSGGPRGCIGEGLAWTEMALVIATLARRWNPKLAGAFELKLQASITLHLPNGLKMRLDR